MKKFVLLLLLVTLLSACHAPIRSNKYMDIKQPDLVYKPESGHALIIFERNIRQTGNYRTLAIWDITSENEPQFIALLSSSMKAAHQTKPGEYFYLQTISGARDVMKAKVEAGKTYFAVAGPGYWNLNEKSVRKVTPNNISVNNENAYIWGNATVVQNSVKGHAAKAMKKWHKLSAENQRKKTIFPKDGR